MSVKGQGHSLTLVKGYSDFKLKLVSRRNSWAIFTKAHMKATGRMEMKIYTNESGHITNMATMPIYGKNLKQEGHDGPGSLT